MCGTKLCDLFGLSWWSADCIRACDYEDRSVDFDVHDIYLAEINNVMWYEKAGKLDEITSAFPLNLYILYMLYTLPPWVSQYNWAFIIYVLYVTALNKTLLTPFLIISAFAQAHMLLLWLRNWMVCSRCFSFLFSRLCPPSFFLVTEVPRSRDNIQHQVCFPLSAPPLSMAYPPPVPIQAPWPSWFDQQLLGWLGRRLSSFDGGDQELSTLLGFFLGDQCRIAGVLCGSMTSWLVKWVSHC